MTLHIDFIDETEGLTETQTKEIENLLQFAAVKEVVEEDTEISITFVENERIQEINREYRNKDKATDVISFAMEEMGKGNPSYRRRFASRVRRYYHLYS